MVTLIKRQIGVVANQLVSTFANNMTTLPLLIFIFDLIFHILGEAQSPVCSGAGGPVSQCPPGCKCTEGIVDCRQVLTKNVYTVKKGQRFSR